MGTWHSLAGNFIAARAGRMTFVWENYYMFASARTLLLHCTKPSLTEAAQAIAPDISVADFIGQPGAQQKESVDTPASPKDGKVAMAASGAAAAAAADGAMA